jgi:dTDP-4-amino-4,6-dideoxygalactose transaminase
VEPRAETFNINPDLIEKAITPNTRAIMPVHLFGQACEMDKIMEIAKRHDLYVVEDNSQAQGASWKGRTTGSFGDINGTSLYPAKNLGALGDAGVITTNNENLAHKVTVLRNYGSQKKYYNEVIGYNSRLDELHAAFLNVKIKYLDKWNQQRIEISKIYREQLSDIEQLALPLDLYQSDSVYHQFVVRTDKRDELNKHLNNSGIGTLIHYPVPPHLQEAYKHLGFNKGDFLIAEELAKTSLSLPIYPGLTEDEVTYVCDTIRTFFKS